MTDIKSALDAVGTAADYSARATYQRGYEAGNESTRAIMAQMDRLVAERDAAERRESELGLQVEAQKARLRLAAAVCDALRRAEAREAEGYDGFGDYYDATAALAAWDAVPGDASRDKCCTCAELSGACLAHPVRT